MWPETYSRSLGNTILRSKIHSRSVGNGIPDCETYPPSCGMLAQTAKPFRRNEKSNRKMRRMLFFLKSLISNLELDFLILKSLIANCAAYFFSEKSNFQTEIRLRKFAEWFRILRRLSHRGTPVAFCAAWFFLGHQSQFALHVPRWNTSRILRRLFFHETPVAKCDKCFYASHNSCFVPWNRRYKTKRDGNA